MEDKQDAKVEEKIRHMVLGNFESPFVVEMMENPGSLKSIIV